MSMIELVRRWRADRRGATALEFALVLPFLLGVSFATIDFGLGTFERHRLNEAARRAARAAILMPPLIPAGVLTDVGTRCTGTADGSVTCAGGTAASFATILAAARSIAPRLAATEISVVYRRSGVASALPAAFRPPIVMVTVTPSTTMAFGLLGRLPGMPGGATLGASSAPALGRAWEPAD